jgi:hypothetical protein
MTSSSIIFRPVGQMNFHTMRTELWSLGDLWRGTDDERLKKRIAERAVELIDALCWRYGASAVLVA